MLPDLDKVSSQRGETLGGRFAKVIVDGLSSSKTDTRAASESLLRACVDNRVFSIGTAKKSASRLKPAKQRSIGPILAKISGSSTESQAKAETSKKTERQVNSRPGVRNSTMANRSQKVRADKSQSKVGGRDMTKAGGPSKQRTADSDSAVSHPLIGGSGLAGRQRSAAALRLLTWPEFPDEPAGPAYFNGLKKAWSPLIPSESTKSLFPDSGIRRQDDAMGGCELLKRAIVMERSGEDAAIIDQLDLILKWGVYVLCKKESTVGLQELLSFFS